MSARISFILLLASFCQEDSFASSFVSGNIACPGVCIDSPMTQYCEAYLTSHDRCGPSQLCCVSKDGYGDSVPSDLVVPNEKKHTKKLITAGSTRKCRGECIRGLLTLVCDNVDDGAFCPGKGTCCIDELQETATPSQHTLTTTNTPRPTTPVTTTKLPSKYNGPTRKCRGECIGPLFAQLCDKKDDDAVCPGEGTCCITESQETATPSHHTPTSTTTPRPTTPVPLPQCPGFCMLKIMSAFCDRPHVLVANTHCEISGNICCDNTRSFQNSPAGELQNQPPKPVSTREKLYLQLDQYMASTKSARQVDAELNYMKNAMYLE